MPVVPGEQRRRAAALIRSPVARRDRGLVLVTGIVSPPRARACADIHGFIIVAKLIPGQASHEMQARHPDRI